MTETLVILGGTGSLGRAILKEQDLLQQHNISRIRIISRCEIKQNEVENSYQGPIELQCFLGDVRSSERMDLGLRGSSYVINCAALKQIHKFELDISEGFKTNFAGAEAVLNAALKHKLKSAIFLGTDKQINPTTAYGVSKLAATHLWLWGNTFQKETKFGVTVYGNVFGSRGSVVEKWHQMADAKIFPITHAEMTRFFITKRNAAKFVLHCLFNNEGKVMIPKMKATPMFDVAETIANYHDIVAPHYPIIGIRKNEKIHEELFDGVTYQNSQTAERFTSDELMDMFSEYVCSS